MKELKTYRDVVLAVLDGHEVEYLYKYNETWLPLVYIHSEIRKLNREIVNYKYRIKPTKPSIDWSQVSDKFNYLARDESGLIYLYENKPEVAHDGWSSVAGVGGMIVWAVTFKSLEVGTCNWTESLVERPKCI